MHRITKFLKGYITNYAQLLKEDIAKHNIAFKQRYIHRMTQL